MPRARKTTASRVPKVSRPRRGRRPSQHTPSSPPVAQSWRETWREGAHRITLSLAGSAGAAAVVVLEWWLRSY
ncbi:hypothetical protein [Streptomyces brevispora]|uniref:hypothetical protein n=1 Tax=Streptomyces brevispora TaxID=887462 RepID=UPI0038237E23